MFRGPGTLILLAASAFYLLVVPMLTALGLTKNGWVGVAFGAFMLAQLFFLIFVYGYNAAAIFYGWSLNIWPFRFAERFIEGFRYPHSRLRLAAVPMMFLSFALLDYAFGVLYVYISHVDPKAFNVGALSGFQGCYFSVLTGSTVAFGDIIPRSVGARLTVVAQIILSLGYVVLLFSAAASHLQSRRIDSE